MANHVTHRTRWVSITLTGVMLVAVVAMGAGCKPAPVEPTIDPQVAPPAIISEGVLSVGVNLGSAPYATEANGGVVGFDAELAAEIAKNLGLTIEYVEVAPDQIAQSLESGVVDLVMSAPLDSTETSAVGEYLSRGSAIFAKEPSGTLVTPADVAGSPVAVQANSPSYWWFVQHVGEDSVTAFDSAAEALDALEAGEVTYAALDSVVGSYAIAGGATVTQVGWVTDPTPVGIALRLGNAELDAAVRAQYDKLDSAGWIEALVRRWLEPAPSGDADSETEPAQE